jgi:hypothetical protein
VHVLPQDLVEALALLLRLAPCASGPCPRERARYAPCTGPSPAQGHPIGPAASPARADRVALPALACRHYLHRVPPPQASGGDRPFDPHGQGRRQLRFSAISSRSRRWDGAGMDAGVIYRGSPSSRAA